MSPHPLIPLAPLFPLSLSLALALLRCEVCGSQSSCTFSVWRFLKDSTGTCCTRVYIFSFASSSSLRFRDIRTRTRVGTLRTPLLQRNLFSFVSTRTSFVLITFSVNLRISRMHRGARFLNWTPCIFLCRWIVQSRVTGSCVFLPPVFFSPFTILDVSPEAERFPRVERGP